MRYEIHTANGLQAITQSRKSAINYVKSLANGPKFAILIKERKNSYPHAGMQGENGIAYKHTMLLYPPNSKCEQFTPEQYLTQAFR